MILLVFSLNKKYNLPYLAAYMADKAQLYSKVGPLYEEAIKRCVKPKRGKIPEITNRYIWFLVYCKETKFRNLDKAFKLCQETIKLCKIPKDKAECLYNLSCVYHVKGNTTKALSLVAQALSIAKDPVQIKRLKEGQAFFKKKKK